jgi:GNAT superfamily N-acetyltransferase
VTATSSVSSLELRAATLADLPVLASLAEAAIEALLGPLLDGAELAASRRIMGIDSALVDDGTYLVAEVDGEVAGCGGWSRRAVLYGGDHSPGRGIEPVWLDPRTDAARVRAMYTAPAFARRGVGRRILEASVDAAAAAGFGRVELLATAAGLPLYEACGFTPVEHVVEAAGGAPVRLVRMERRLRR